jgi:DNA-binding SARP family transcriptional activator
MPSLLIQLLGGFSARLEPGWPIKLPTRKTEAILARLAGYVGEPVSRAELVRLLWSDRPLEQARGSLRQAIAALKRELGDEHAEALIVTRDSIALSPDRVIIDLVEFKRLAEQASE